MTTAPSQSNDGANCPTAGPPFCDIMASIETSTNASCLNAADGSVDITVIGGIAPYTYAWSDLTGTNQPEDRVDLAAGTYTLNVTDNTGLCATSLTVTLETDIDTGSPSITCPDPFTIDLPENTCAITYNPLLEAPPTVQDNCSLSENFTLSYFNEPSSFVWSFGTHSVEIVATDETGNISTCTIEFTVVVTDAVDISCPENITVSNDAGICGAVVDYDLPETTDYCALIFGLTLTQDAGLGSGATFPVGDQKRIFLCPLQN